MNDSPGGVSGRFVLLEHEHNGVHWDFMLEAGGALWTWALRALPERGREVVARRLPDHRLAYLSYEGPISGDRGRVRRVAEGTHRTAVAGAGCLKVELAGDQLVGTVDLYDAGSGVISSSPSDGYTWVFRLGNVD
ncbi:ATP-dependent DNA ligase [Aquisphaera giovannonii]|uniref:ATP-dependent DNA ligase n=1 Tax=Aquisphaera giovannonii TaxID=406548 RepID=A0A5B9W0Q1_9BACT|nr:DNA polymerase ligase N-terminal domain-containing protein [Aquisphaera giovannonii]QEH33535.1 ATP-dependent DNA ligase [Aquisphaera giovannonii]